MDEDGLELKKIPPTYWHIHHSKQMHKSALPNSRQAHIGRERERMKGTNQSCGVDFFCHYEIRFVCCLTVLSI